MTVEELKSEAKKLGYRITPIRKYIKLLPCTCGRKQLGGWWWDSENHVYFYKCPICDMEGPPGKTDREARKNWNTMIESLRKD